MHTQTDALQTQNLTVASKQVQFAVAIARADAAVFTVETHWALKRLPTSQHLELERNDPPEKKAQVELSSIHVEFGKVATLLGALLVQLR